MTCLYRHFAADGELLYVGISLSAVNRLGQHKANSAWFERIARVDIQRLDTIQAARAAERKAIEEERPACNIQFTRPSQPKSRPKRRAERASGWTVTESERGFCISAPCVTPIYVSKSSSDPRAKRNVRAALHRAWAPVDILQRFA